MRNCIAIALALTFVFTAVSPVLTASSAVHGPTVVWTHTFKTLPYPGEPSTPQVVDLDGNGVNEILLISGDSVYVLTASGTVKWTYSINGIFTGAVAADLDGNGEKEVVAVTDSGTVHCLSADGAHLWSYETGGSIRATPAIADMNGDGKLEIYVGTMKGDLVILGSQGTLVKKVSLLGPIVRPIIIGAVAERPILIVAHSNMIEPLEKDGQKIFPTPFTIDNGSAGLAIGSELGTDLLELPKNSNLCVMWDWIESPPGCVKPSINLTSSPVFADLDGDGKSEILVGTSDNNLLTYRLEDQAIWQGWQTSIGSGIVGISTALAPEMNVIVMTKDGRIVDLDHNGLKLWEKDLGIAVNRSAILADVDKNSEMEILVVGTGGELVLLDTHQVLKAGWPLANHDIANTRNFHDTEPGGIIKTSKWTYLWPTAGANITSVLADVNGDGKDEVFMTDNFASMKILTGDGHLLAERAIYKSHWLAPIAADVNGDGAKEIILGNDKEVEVWSSLLVSIWNYSLPLTRAVAAGDLNGDGLYEVIAGNATGRTVAFRGADGVPLWSVNQGANIVSITVADLGTDGSPDVITTDGNNIMTIRNANNGTLEWSNSVLSGEPIPPVVADLDGDGRLDVAVASKGGNILAYSGNGTQMWAINAPGMPLAMIAIDGNATGQDLAMMIGGTGKVVFLDGMKGKTLGTITLSKYNIGFLKMVAAYLGLTDPVDTGILDNGSVLILANRTEAPLNFWVWSAGATDVNLGDLDGDGLIDVMFTGQNSTVFSLGVGPGPTIPWSMTGHDPEQTYNPFAKGGMIYPDLTLGPEDITFDPIVINGNITANVTITYHNQGPEPTSEFNITLFNGGTTLTTLNAPPMAPFSEAKLKYKYTVGYKNSSLTVLLDSGNVIKELNENNNKAIRYFFKNERPVAVAGPSLRTDPNKAVIFDGTKSHDSDDDIVSYLWDFKDGSTMKGPIGAHTFNKSGTYNVTLTVTDEFGAIGIANRTVIVNHAPTFTDWKPKGDITLNEGETVDIWTTTNDLDGDKVTVSWYLDKVKMAEGPSWSFWANYSSFGTHTVTASATDGRLVTNLTWALKIIQSNRLIEDATPPSPVTIPEGQSQQFDVVLSQAAQGALTDWYLDGARVLSGTESFGIFAGAGTQGYHTLRFQVQADNDTDFYEWNVTIGPKTDVSKIRWAFPNGTNIATTLDTPVYLGISSDEGAIQWYIDGVAQVGQNGQSFRFDQWGNDSYNVTVMVSSGTTTVTHNWKVTVNYPPVANIDASALNVNIGKKVNFDGSKSKAHKATDSITTYKWDFGDGTTDQGPQVKHSFKTAGGYSVKLTVTDSKGQTSSSSVVIVVEPNQQAATPGFEGIVLAVAVVIAAFAFRRRQT